VKVEHPRPRRRSSFELKLREVQPVKTRPRPPHRHRLRRAAPPPADRQTTKPPFAPCLRYSRAARLRHRRGCGRRRVPRRRAAQAPTRAARTSVCRWLGGLDAVARLRTLPIVQRRCRSSRSRRSSSASTIAKPWPRAATPSSRSPLHDIELLDTLARRLRLTWLWRESPHAFEPAAASGEAVAEPPLLLAEIDDLLALRGGGDVDALREHVAAALLAARPARHSLRRSRRAGRRFQDRRIRHLLLDARSRSTAAPR